MRSKTRKQSGVLSLLLCFAGCSAALGENEGGEDKALRLLNQPTAERMQPGCDWKDLRLASDQKQSLESMLSQRQGVHAVFAGPAGTGKTLAAEVMAAELGRKVYRVDTARIVSKYIGETEKNLARIFDRAASTGAVLLFDEADALFGKRSEVRDSNDRYANLEVSYLLQRMEDYRGITILTTNSEDDIDPALLRRIGYVVAFSTPQTKSGC